MPRHRLRLAGIATLVVALIVAAAVAVGFGYRRDLAEIAIRRALADAGMAAADLHVEEAGLERLVLTNVRGGPAADLALRRFVVAYTPQELLKRRIRRIQIEGLEAVVHVDAGGIAIDGFDVLPSTGGSGTEGGWEVAAIDIEDAAVAIAGPVGARVTLNGEVLATDGGGYHGEIRIDGTAGDSGDIRGVLSFITSGSRSTATLAFDVGGLTLPAGGIALSASGTVAAILDAATVQVTVVDALEVNAASADGPLSLRIAPSETPLISLGYEGARPESLMVRLAEASISALDHRFKINDADAVIMLEPTTAIDVRTLRIADTARPPLTPPLTLEGNVTLEPGRLPFRAHLTSLDGQVKADVSGAWVFETGEGEAAIQLHPVRFAPGRLQPQHLAPSLALPLADVDGRMAASGRLTWSGERLRPDLRVSLDTLSMQAFGARLQDIDGVIRLTGLAPLQALSDPVITIGRIEAGVPITDAELRFTLDAGRRLHITDAGADLLGGQVRQADGMIDLEGPAYRGALDVAGLDLQALLDLAELDAATATGKVSGRIPIVFEGGALAIDHGVLATEQPGILRYTPAAPPAALQPQGQGQGLGLALQALENFHYDTLRIAVDGGSGRGWTSSVTISGKNPDFMEGYPFVFNINLSGDLDRVVLSGLLGMTLPDRIQDRLNQR